ncbi:MAG: helix-turn-helix domain-containing protein [Planctomycetaceae bacterium]|nr:helix-turn-helix domain-containing protein [Planctomycetaceae bacterium]
MSQFYDITKTAEVLGLKPADVQMLREQNKLRGFRDGASWKFKVDDVQNYLAQSIKAKHEAEAEADEDLVLGGSAEVAGGSDLELGAGSSDLQLGAGGSDLELGAGSSDLEIGAGNSDLEIGGGSDLELGPGSSDLQMGGSDLELTETEFELAGGSDINLGGERKGPSGSDLELDLTLDQDVSLGESDIALASEEKAEGGSDLEVGADVLDDEDLILGGSGAGSDVTIGGDSGISLVDPADSGLSLEEPLDLTSEDEESLELGEDDMLTLEETEAVAEVETDDEFNLTPLEEVGDEESGSQVIALDTEDESAVAAVMPAMLDEDAGFGGGGVTFAEAAAPMDMVSMSAAAASAAPMAAGPMLQEAPYSGLWVWLGLFPCTLMLVLAGTMSFDLIRNMWSWQGTTAIGSTLLDVLKGMLF